ncbi:MAG: type II toxin-antitoxin system prevent-host-death family antitoxin [Rectinemataceae bacterium]|jgi:antitoxin (DNA-binding transcriptional repressor) of toxin-antitoxin stability system
MTVTIHEAKTHLSRLIQKVLEGEEVIIAKGSKPVVTLHKAVVPGERISGRNKGKIVISEDFDSPLAEFSEYQ